MMRALAQSRIGQLIGASIVAMGVFVSISSYPAYAQASETHLLSVYDRGEKRTFITEAETIVEALEEQDFLLDTRDVVEPSRDEKLIAPEYVVNIYRARPVVIEDGAVRMATVSAYQTPMQIARDVGFALQPEDVLELTRSADVLYDGPGLVLTIKRATPITVDLYGRSTQLYTHAATVQEFLEEKNIILGTQDRVSVGLTTRITEGFAFRIWREGTQTLTIDSPLPFVSEIIYDADRPLGYRETSVVGVDGVESITYEIEIKDGTEVSRIEIARVTTTQPTKQTEVIGLYNDGSGLTKSRGAQQFVDSNGVSHRETYYDLPMNVVMRGCGQSGYYTVRPDGAKVDAQGYVIIAANYARYPRCSIVETSLGPAKVYDTGGFAAVHPDGFDLATDWTNYNGI